MRIGKSDNEKIQQELDWLREVIRDLQNIRAEIFKQHGGTAMVWEQGTLNTLTSSFEKRIGQILTQQYLKEQ